MNPAPEVIKEVPTAVVPEVTLSPDCSPAGAEEPIPDTLPDITLADRDGKPTKLASFGGPAVDGEFLGDLVRPLSPRDPAAQ